MRSNSRVVSSNACSWLEHFLCKLINTDCDVRIIDTVHKVFHKYHHIFQIRMVLNIEDVMELKVHIKDFIEFPCSGHL